MNGDADQTVAAREGAADADERFDGDRTDALRIAYRHDVHKLRGRSHEAALDEYAGVPVNEEVPFGADGDGAALSRPPDDPEPRLEHHVSPMRVSAVTGDRVGESKLLQSGSPDASVRALIVPEDPARLHRAWLESAVAASFNESIYYPFTSLKYHVLLVGALVANYWDGYERDEVWLQVDSPGTIVPYRTIYAGPMCSLQLTGEPDRSRAACLGSGAARVWGRVWSRLPTQPLAVDESRRERVVDAQLRRLMSWSTALQYLEDYREWQGMSG